MPRIDKAFVVNGSLNGSCGIENRGEVCVEGRPGCKERLLKNLCSFYDQAKPWSESFSLSAGNRFTWTDSLMEIHPRNKMWMYIQLFQPFPPPWIHFKTLEVQ